MGPPQGRCLICYQDCALVRRTEFSCAIISKELHAIFILRNIFEVPSETIEEYLETGTNPSEWIQLCKDCKVIVEKGKRMYKDILDASKKFRKVKGDIIQCLRRNKVKVPQRRGRLNATVGVRVTDETRRFVFENNYSESLVDPFVGGDCRAETLLYSGNVVPEVNDSIFYGKVVKRESEYVNPDEMDFGDFDDDQDLLASPASNLSFYSEDKNTPSSVPPLKFRRKLLRNTDAEGAHHTANGSAQNSKGEMEWFCSCGRTYTGSEKLRRHLREANMTSSEKFKCPFCEKEFKRNWDVKRHLSHHKDKEGNLPEGHTVASVLNMVSSSRIKPARTEAFEGEESDQEDASNDAESNVVSSTGTSGESVRHEQEKLIMADGTSFWKCSCGKIYLSASTLSQHLKETQSEPSPTPAVPTIISCSICDITFKRRIERNQHLKKVHGIDGSTVLQISEPIAVPASFLNDADNSIGEAQIQMVEEEVLIQDTFVAMGNLEEVESQEGDGTVLIKVTELENLTDMPPDEEGHEELGLFETSDGTEVWKCACGKLYSSQTALHRHFKEKTMDPSSWLNCEYCDRTFKRGSELRRHVSNVHEKKKWDCKNCGKSFKALAMLNAHQKMICPGS